MGVIAILVNCYLIGQCGQLQRLFPWLSPEMTIISIVLLEVCTVLWMVHAGWFMKSFVVLMHRYCSCFPQVTPFNVRKEVQMCMACYFLLCKTFKIAFFFNPWMNTKSHKSFCYVYEMCCENNTELETDCDCALTLTVCWACPFVVLVVYSTLQSS